MNFVKMIRQELNCYLKRIDVLKIVFVKESSKIVLKLFLKKPSTNYDTPSSYESTDTKIFKKIEQELAF